MNDLYHFFKLTFFLISQENTFFFILVFVTGLFFNRKKVKDFKLQEKLASDCFRFLYKSGSFCEAPFCPSLLV